MKLSVILVFFTATLFAQSGKGPVLGGRHLAFSVELAKVYRTGFSEGPSKKVSIGLEDLPFRTYHVAYIAPLKRHPGLALRLEGSMGSGVDSSLWKNKVIPEPGQSDYIGWHDLSVTENHSFFAFGLELLAFRALSPRFFPFLFGGLHAKSFTYHENWTIRDDTRADGMTASPDFPFESSNLVFEPTGGAGFFLRLSPNFMLSLQYRCRYSTPVEYSESVIGTGFTQTQRHLSQAAEAGVVFRI